MHALDASGRRVSLLNDDTTASYQQPYHVSQPPYGALTRSLSSSPNTPELLRSDSYDSNMSNEPISPMTPIYDYSSRMYPVEARSPYEEYMDYPHSYSSSKLHYSDARSMSYDEDAAPSPPVSDRPGKRYPCRYRESHGCDKTFTTSGHASRHSKIHTAEKAVPCTFQGCAKKFTRADNMKQHLETHYKDKSRSSSSRPSLVDKKSSSSTKISSRSKAAAALASASPLPSPAGGAWDMRGLDLPLLTPSVGVRTPSSGLDALAMAVACQEGS